MSPSARKALIITCIAVSAFVVACGLPVAALVWAAYNTPTPVEQEVGAAAPTPATTSQLSPTTTTAAATTPVATTPRPATTPSGFDRAAWDAYWSSWAQASYGRHVTDVSWNGIAFIVHTDLVADLDAKTPATQICMAASGFWAPGFRPVQVYDRAETVLVSRRSAGESCTWRR